MTIAEQHSRIIYTGNDATTQFAYGYPLWDTNDLGVIIYDTEENTETIPAPSTYSLAASGDLPYSNTVVTYPLVGDPLTTTEQIILYRTSPLAQTADLTNQQAYFLTSLEAELDRITTWFHEADDRLDRALTMALSTPLGSDVQLGPFLAGGVLRWSTVEDDYTLESVDIISDIIEQILSDEGMADLITASFDTPEYVAAWTALSTAGIAANYIPISRGLIAQDADVDALLDAGYYRYSAAVTGVTNLPLTTADGFLVVETTGTSHVQTFTRGGAGSNRLWTRLYEHEGSWSDWVELTPNTATTAETLTSSGNYWARIAAISVVAIAEQPEECSAVLAVSGLPTGSGGTGVTLVAIHISSDAAEITTGSEITILGSQNSCIPEEGIMATAASGSGLVEIFVNSIADTSLVQARLLSFFTSNAAAAAITLYTAAAWASGNPTGDYTLQSAGLRYRGYDVHHDGNYPLEENIARLVATTSEATGTNSRWTLIATVTPTASGESMTFTLAAEGRLGSTYANLGSVTARFLLQHQDISQVLTYNSRVDIISATAGIRSDCFRVISDGWQQPIYIYFRENGGDKLYNIYEMSMHHHPNMTIAYHSGQGWTGTEPTASRQLTSQAPNYLGNRFLTEADEGSGNGLDADTIDGVEAAALASISHSHLAADITDAIDADTLGGFSSTYFAALIRAFVDWSDADTDIDALLPGSTNGTIFNGFANEHVVIGIKGNDTNDGFYIIDTNDGGDIAYARLLLAVRGNAFEYLGNRVLTVADEGSGNGLDADTIDGVEAAALALLAAANTFLAAQTISSDTPAVNLIETDTTTASRLSIAAGYTYLQAGAAGSGQAASSGYLRFSGFLGADLAELQVRYGGTYADIWHAGNDGHSSGLDADTIDGAHADADATASTVALRDADGGITTASIRSTTNRVAHYLGGYNGSINSSTEYEIGRLNFTTSSSNVSVRGTLYVQGTTATAMAKINLFVRSTVLPSISAFITTIPFDNGVTLSVTAYIHPTSGDVVLAYETDAGCLNVGWDLMVTQRGSYDNFTQVEALTTFDNTGYTAATEPTLGVTYSPANFNVNPPPDCWSDKTALFHNFGGLYSGGSYRITLTSNHYRDSSGSAYLGINGITDKGSSVDLDPGGTIYLRGGTAVTTVLPTMLELNYDDDTIEFKGDPVYHQGNTDEHYTAQATPTTITAAATLTTAQVASRLLTVDQGGSGTIALTLPLATAMTSAHPACGDDFAFDFAVLNLSTTSGEDAIITTNTGWTLVGNMYVEPDTSNAARSSATFRAVRTSATTWTLYRVA